MSDIGPSLIIPDIPRPPTIREHRWQVIWIPEARSAGPATNLQTYHGFTAAIQNFQKPSMKE